MKFIWTMRPEIRPRAHFSLFLCFWDRLGMLPWPPGLEKHSCKVHVISMKMVKSKKSQKELMGGLGGRKN